MLDRKREQGDYQKSPPPEESRTELFLGMISMVFVQGLSNHLLGHLSRDISGNPNSPSTMGNWCLNQCSCLSHTANYAIILGLGAEPDSRLPGVSSNPPDPVVCPTTNTTLHSSQTHKGSLSHKYPDLGAHMHYPTP